MKTKKIEEQAYEFIFYINNHIICQRYFDIRDFNKSRLEAHNMKDLLDTITGMNNGNYGELGIIPNFLKEKTCDYLWGYYNPYEEQSTYETKNNNKIDNFQFEIKVNKVSVGKSIFSGNPFPPKVRYSVDIKEIIPSIISEIRNYLSEKNYKNVGV